MCIYICIHKYILVCVCVCDCVCVCARVCVCVVLTFPRQLELPSHLTEPPDFNQGSVMSGFQFLDPEAITGHTMMPSLLMQPLPLSVILNSNL